MNIEDAYNCWSQRYDSDENKTRDLEATSLRETLSGLSFSKCLEIGCGTGKNSEWLLTISGHVTAVDLSNEMLSIAKQKINAGNVTFVKADVTKRWSFADSLYDLVTFSLVLEHIEDLDGIFQKLSDVIRPGGKVYIGELHPFKQYTGTKARFETPEGCLTVPCFNHHVSDFATSSRKYGFEIELIKEYFDDRDRTRVPRILTLFLRKK